MPFIEVSPPMGPLNVCYFISTPKAHDATEIEPDVPTILFLHPSFVGSQIYEAQFSDPQLRIFNLVAFDMRNHAQTKGRWGDKPIDLVEDIRHVVDAIGIPSFHIFTMAMVCDVALEFAAKYPNHALSVTLCSPPSKFDSEEATAGRLEHFKSWKESFIFTPNEKSRTGSDVWVREDIEDDALVGFQALAFNMESTPLHDAVSFSSLQQGLANMDSPDSIDGIYNVTVKWPSERKRMSQDMMKRIQAPVHVVHFTEDVIFAPEEVARELADDLREAGVNSSLRLYGGPHYGCIHAASEINPALRELVLSAHPGEAQDLASLPITAERVDNTSMLKTPFQELLANYSYHGTASAESDSD